MDKKMWKIPFDELTPEQQKERREEVYRIRASDPTPARVLSMPPGVDYSHLFTGKNAAEIGKGGKIDGINYNYKRAIEDKEFKEDLKSGILRPLVDLVNNSKPTDPSKPLCMAFRGHYLNVYHKAHSVFRIEKISKGYKMTFNFNHSRYSANREIDRGDMEKWGWKPDGSSSTYSVKITSDGYKYWAETISCCTELINDFCCENKKIDYVRPRELKDKSPRTEKKRQQEIALKNCDTSNGYFIYDTEYVQGLENNQQKSFGRFDMLAIRFEEKIPKAIVFIELKSTISALDKTSGVKAHYAAMKSYTENECLVDVRIEDAENIINFYKELGMADFEDALELSNLKPEILFIFTDEAINYPDKLGEYIDLHGKEGFKLKREKIKTK